MPKLNKAEKTAVKKVKAQASSKVEVKANSIGRYPGDNVITFLQANNARVGKNAVWGQRFNGYTVAELKALKPTAKVRMYEGGVVLETNAGALNYMVKHNYVAIQPPKS
tara:strand:+ start:145 stop:471 length:327 start_codon:yes stop_codon:yes gene_type:complete